MSLYPSSLDRDNAKTAQRDFMKSLSGVDVHKPDVRVPINGAAYTQAMDSIAAIKT